MVQYINQRMISVITLSVFVPDGSTKCRVCPLFERFRQCVIFRPEPGELGEFFARFLGGWGLFARFSIRLVFWPAVAGREILRFLFRFRSDLLCSGSIWEWDTTN